METEDKFLDSFTERYKHCDFLYAKNDQHKLVHLEFEKGGSPYLSIYILTFDYNKLKLKDDMKITYNEKPCKIYLKTLCANAIKGHHFKRNTYLQIMLIGFSDMMWKVFGSLMNLTNQRNKKLNFFADPILTKINFNRKPSLNKMIYFDDLVIHFDKVYDINYRGKIRFVTDAYVCSSKIMLPA